jgi:RHS repeat-associated protein
MARSGVGMSVLRYSVALSFIAFLFTSSSAQAQITDVTNTTSTPIPGVGHDYIKMLSETVNPANGSVSVRIQAPTPPGRRMSLPFAFAYDSNGAHHIQTDGMGTVEWWDNTAYIAAGGWSYSIPMATNMELQESCVPGACGPATRCVWDNDFVFQDETGGRHSLYLAIDKNPSVCQHATPRIPIQVYSGGDNRYRAALTAPTSPLFVADADGTVYTFTCCYMPHAIPIGDTTQAQSAVVSSIEDRNGNKINVADTGSGKLSATDTVGRTVLSTSGFGTTGNTVTVSGLSGPYTVTWGTASSNYAVGQQLVSPPNPFGCNTISNDVQTLNVITKITLPNNTFYAFSYDPTYGSISKITYPNGGYVSYSYGLNPLSEDSKFEGVQAQGSCEYHHDSAAVLHRYVSFDGSTIALQQDFSYSTTWSSTVSLWSTKTTAVTTTDKITGQASTTVYTYGGVTLRSQPNDQTRFSGQAPVEASVVYKNASGSVIQTVAKSWFGVDEMASQQTTLDNGLTSKTTFSYGPGAQVTERDDYDYGSGAPGALLRKTTTTYQAFAATPIFPSTASIFDRPCQVITYDGSSNKVAETDSYYDSGTTLCGTAPTPALTGTGSYTGHDETLYGTTATVPRGNLTQRVLWATAGASPTMTYTYDETGQVTSKKDPCGNTTCSDMTGTAHTTTYSYADHYTVLSGGSNVTYTPSVTTNAYLTQITDPLGQTANFTYDFNNGQLTVAKDLNSQTDNYIYNDPFARPTQMNYADGGQTSFAYNDATYNQANNTPNAQSTKLIVSGVNLVHTTAMDGVAHTARTLINSDPVAPDAGDLSYDGLGRKRTETNPHRSGSSSTDGTVTYNYDAVSRITSVVKQDGSTATTSYSGNCTTVTDEAGKSRRSCSDALGRLTQVFEDPNTLNYETDYTYDTLGNLLTVNQKGNDPNSANWRARTFTYDSLSRVITASNPETGAVCYGTWSGSSCINGYDANSNLSKKTDARGITITYGYDVLDRLISKSYSNGDPTVSYTYDAFVNGTNYGIGHRTGMTDGSGSTTWTFDTMGREWSETRTIGTVSKTVNTQYNLDGSVKQVTYPADSGTVLQYSYDSAAELTQIKDTAHNITYFQNASYYPTGALNQATYGSVVETSIFSNRLQPCWYYATASTPLAAGTVCTGTATAANVLDLKYNFGIGTNDNGTVLAVTNDKDSNRSVAYSYDALNRIASAATPNTDCTVLTGGITKNWGESFTIDPWGNLTNRTVTKCSAEGLSVVALNNNRLSGFGYDADGNMTSNGSVTYTYDGESRLTLTAGVTYTYDGDGERVKKSSGTEYWGSGPLLESDASGNLQREFIFAGGKRIARRDIATGSVYYYFSDLLGSADVVTNSTGVIQNESDYYPYGGERVYSQGLANQNYKFTGKERDYESGLDNFGARFDSSSLGRFMTPDWAARPIAVPYANFGDPQSLNLYGYVRNDPVSRADADGHDPQGAAPLDPETENLKRLEGQPQDRTGSAQNKHWWQKLAGILYAKGSVGVALEVGVEAHIGKAKSPLKVGAKVGADVKSTMTVTTEGTSVSATKEAQAGVNVGKIIIGPQTSTENVTVKNGGALANPEVEKSSSAMFGTERAEGTLSKGDFGVGAEIDAGVLVVGFEVGVDFDKVKDLFNPH